MWTAKKGDERKKEFIATAIELFTTKGYEKTSINDILKTINVTKGAFYYYFDSKEGLLDEVVDYLTQEMQKVVHVVSSKEDLSATAKLQDIFTATNQFRKDNAAFYRQLYALQKKEENAYIARKFMQKALSSNKQYIESIILQGIEEGIFTTSNPEEMAELYIRLSSLCKEKIAAIITQPSFQDDIDANHKKINDFIMFYQTTLERALGAASGTLDFFTNE